MELPGNGRSRIPRPPVEGALASERMRTTISTRVACSFKALGITWFVSGTIFCLIVKGPDTLSFWCIWGSAFFALGWFLVGLPLLAFGERIFHAPLLLLIFAGGLGGALVMALPAIVFGYYLPPGAHWKHSLNDLKWEGIAFVAAALTTGLYCRFLHHEAAE
jgi:hypothetical protein